MSLHLQVISIINRAQN